MIGSGTRLTVQGNGNVGVGMDPALDVRLDLSDGAGHGVRARSSSPGKAALIVDSSNDARGLIINHTEMPVSGVPVVMRNNSSALGVDDPDESVRVKTAVSSLVELTFKRPPMASRIPVRRTDCRR